MAIWHDTDKRDYVYYAVVSMGNLQEASSLKHKRRHGQKNCTCSSIAFKLVIDIMLLKQVHRAFNFLIKNINGKRLIALNDKSGDMEPN